MRTLPFETQMMERYRRGESSVEEALVEMCPAGVSVRRVEEITEALWGQRVSLSTVSQFQPEDLPADQSVAQSTDQGPVRSKCTWTESG